MSEREIKGYLLAHRGGKITRVDVPADWKITFGPLVPGAPRESGTLALRIYEAKDRQRAIFTDVKSFVAIDLPMRCKVLVPKKSGAVPLSGDEIRERMAAANNLWTLVCEKNCEASCPNCVARTETLLHWLGEDAFG